MVIYLDLTNKAAQMMVVYLHLTMKAVTFCILQHIEVEWSIYASVNKAIKYVAKRKTAVTPVR